ncbi:A/G-specific DNA-adenine glycosylase [Ekhidna lutea]|uniref:Adenine DNA glycosylase n=1 Tax=Ekhidna lutea TaxID=447679 RepID=A0A239ER24_EKHLU|nr:A/G-specific adenine glycosylase [Ekhidna lutea]SNS47085.1 A/G-specific DNA-adenine glycosylase [Ekhidna lutea]
MKTFAERLINWYTERKRDLPWRKTKDPYPVWLSEIILQQTRVDQGLPYWLNFMETFPTINDLANAPEEKVLRLWQGLGYYSRARNLHFTAKYISKDLKGVFPSSYNEILKLKGIGPYTAAAIASICFDEPRPVVDGNVFRFASRYFGIKSDISKASTRRVFEKILEEEISLSRPGIFNQAMMEFGATVCSPSPQCDQCEFQFDCFAFKNKSQKSLPVKTAKTKVRDRHFHYVVFKNHECLFLNERREKDVWTGLFDFYLLEGKKNEVEVMEETNKKLNIEKLLLEDVSTPFVHILSHQKIFARFYLVDISDHSANTLMQNSALKSYSVEEVLNLPKPKLIVNYLQRIGIE